MSEATDAPKSVLQRLLDVIETVGNKVPHPAVLFALLIVVVVLLAHVLYLLGTSVSYERVNLETHKVVEATTTVNSLLTGDGIRFVCTSVVPNFINFGPVGIILVAMIGVGLAERSGLIQTLIRKIVLVAPRSSITAIVVTLGLLSSIASDAGYLVLIPLGAAAFHSIGKHPLAGLAAAFAGVAAAFGVNFLVKPIDGILAEMTNDALPNDPGKWIPLTANFYFGIGSSVLLIVVCTVITSWVVEPRLGRYRGEGPAEEGKGLSPAESRGLRYALIALLGIVLLIALLTVPPAAPLRNPTNGEILGRSPFMDSLVFLIMVVFFVTGLTYGLGAKTIKSTRDTIDAITRTIADLGELLFLFFVISQFVAYFNYSNIGTIVAVKLADTLQALNLTSSVPLLLAFLVIGFLLSIPIPNILPKWAIIAPVFVPLFLKLGVQPDVVLAAYRVSDSPPNVINPLLPHFALVVGFAQKWQRDAGVGTIVAMMLPYAAVTFVLWSLFFIAWYQLGIPFGPT